MRTSLVSSALVGIVVGFGSSIAIVIAGAQALGADAVQIASWVSGICLGTGVASIVLSVRHRLPMITAWSTPGAALIAATAVGGVPAYTMEAAVGA
ncbi:MAG: benzoate/H(+) symporter BenE family transporter, partial [Alphaproteobacteria bacterium]|nr:benzoate/H(+) symporter BenE family transporter [Alphaproteobacteria bacterium]